MASLFLRRSGLLIVAQCGLVFSLTFDVRTFEQTTPAQIAHVGIERGRIVHIGMGCGGFLAALSRLFLRFTSRIDVGNDGVIVIGVVTLWVMVFIGHDGIVVDIVGIGARGRKGRVEERRLLAEHHEATVVRRVRHHDLWK